MKTTLNIDDSVVQRLREEAARRGSTMSELVEAGLRYVLGDEPVPASGRRALLPLPRWRSGGVRVDLADRGALHDLMDGPWTLVVDTSVLLYVADRDSDIHAPCRRLVDDLWLQPAPVFLTWGICYELLWVSTPQLHFGRAGAPAEAWRFIAALLSAPGSSLLRPTERHAAVLRQTLLELPDLRGNLMHDLHTAVLMREHGASRICTRDADFHRFPFLSVVDPLRWCRDGRWAAYDIGFWVTVHAHRSLGPAAPRRSVPAKRRVVGRR